jgi:hypothetical protein
MNSNAINLIESIRLKSDAAWAAYTAARDATKAPFAAYMAVRDRLFAKYNGDGPDRWDTADRAEYYLAEHDWSVLAIERDRLDALYIKAQDNNWGTICAICAS